MNHRPDIDLDAVVKGAVDIKKNHMDRLENLAAVKGEKFKKAVEFIVTQTNLHTLTANILKMADTPLMLSEVHADVSASINAELSVMYCKALGIESKDINSDDGVLVWAKRLFDDLAARTEDLANKA